MGDFAQYLAVTGPSYRNYTDIVAFHYYGANPETVLDTHYDLQELLQTYGLSDMPIMNTEAGYATSDILATSIPPIVSSVTFPGWLARAYIWGAFVGVQRFLYYSYDGFSGLFSALNTGTYNPAGRAQVQIGQWLQGATFGDCYNTGNYSFYCDVERTSNGLAHLVWNSTDVAASFSIPSTWAPVVEAETLAGARYSVVGSTSQAISGFPILVKPNSRDWVYDSRDAVATYYRVAPAACNLPGTYSAQVLADAPRAYYKMRPPSGTAIADSSGFGNNASISGSVASPQNVSGALYRADDGALNFNAGNVAVANGVQAPVGVNPWGGNFSIEFWANIDQFTGQPEQIAVVQESYLTNGFRMGFGNNKKRMEFWTTESGGSIDLLQTADLATGAWNHFVLTHDAVAATFSLYVNGLS